MLLVAQYSTIFISFVTKYTTFKINSKCHQNIWLRVKNCEVFFMPEDYATERLLENKNIRK
jgi:hypothetical protein